MQMQSQCEGSDCSCFAIACTPALCLPCVVQARKREHLLNFLTEVRCAFSRKKNNWQEQNMGQENLC